MRDTSVWKRLICIAMTTMMAGTLLAGCGSSRKEAAAEAATESDTSASEENTAATEAATEADAKESSDTAATTTDAASDVAEETGTDAAAVSTADAAATSEGTTRKDGLAPFVYVGNSEEGKICTTQAYAYAEESYDLSGGDVVVIPAFVVADESENDGSLQLLANIWVYVFELDGTTLRLTSGGSYPCRINARGGEITSVETAYTDEDTLTLCGGDESLVRILHDDDALNTSLRNNVGMYVNNYGYNIDTYEIGSETYAVNPQ